MPNATVPDATVRFSVGILGTGWVGASVAMSVLHAGFAGELLLSDLRAELAEGEAMDLAHGAAFYPAATVRAAPFDELLATNALVIAAGRGGKPGESRLDLLRDNARVMRDVGARLRDYRGLVVVVTNPVDVLTYVVAESSGLPVERVIGTGTMLDSARLRQAIGEALHVAPHSVHAHVVGEHGDSEVVLWSSAWVGGRPLRQWPGWTREREAPMAEQVRRAAYEIIRRKGATNHAIGLVTAALLRSSARGERRVQTVSRVQRGALGLHDVALSLPTIVDTGGAVEVVAPELAPEERAALERSADVLRDAIRSIA
ncbi:Lactate/malate dehydrogenase [Gemmatirosa kalamazoonensis]|uniref:Lactate/malate dehydrogenase n=1 Tax=Gemmatirosa kalamazoonensis TaxID=861299 RepID=W0RFP7_9BACT|nr:lactate dehydrogenase [Gemmatirosa kalamazoonensis]AHG88193.1 Lactate/malate dehydrogenase [Gemmatirosa kalamazoonensis]